jgi:uncharacterized protein with GYD domain
MAKFLVAASYTPDGLRGLAKDTASGRKKAVEEALASVGGKLEGMYFSLGTDDVYLIADCPDNLSAAALAVTASSTGLVRTRTTPLFTVDEMDRLLGKSIVYRAPGA